jgi:homoserine O-acetyltransferase/O-succinyltransferase
MGRLKGRAPFSILFIPLLLVWSMAWAGAPAPAPALTSPGPHRPEHQIANLGDFRFESGEIVKDFKVSYVTHGKLSAKKDNVILVMDSFTSNHHVFDYLIGSGKALDPDKYFVVATDGLGNADLSADLTTGPTNSGLKMEFPRYTLRDSISADYRLLREHLGVDHLLAATGGSMGAMKAFQFAISHPAYISGIIPIDGGPVTNPQVKAMIRNWMDVIALDPGWHGGNYEVNPTTGLVTALMNFVPWYYTPQWFELNAKTLDAYRAFRKRWHDTWTIRSPKDARDIYYRWQAWADFNVGDTPSFKGDAAAALRSIKAKVLIIGSKDDQLVRREELIFAKNHIPNATFIELDSPLGHLAPFGFDSDLTKLVDREIARFLSKLQ